MKKITTIICCVLLLSDANAQDCNKEVIMNAKGKWTMLANNVVYPEKTFPSNQYSQLYTRLDKIANLFQQAYPQPTGIDAKWYRSIRGAAIVKNGPVPYQFNSLYLGWYCNQNLHKLMLGTETGTWAYVFVNDLHWFLNDQYDQLWMKINNTTVYFLPPTKEQWKGMTVYAVSANRDISKAVLITQNDELPYKPVSRLSFLQALKEKVETDKKNQLEAQNKTPLKTDAEEEKIRQNELAYIEKNYPVASQAKAKERYLKNYKSDKQRREEDLQRSAKYYDDRLKIIDDVWKNETNEELQQPAIIESTINFKGFTTLEKGRMLVVIDPSYFNMQLPKYVPQIIMLYWQWDNSAPAENFKKQIEENFPIDKLKAMIDK
jgi:hypothetical protein